MLGKKRILIISDSLALPRSQPEYTAYEETYPFLLKQEYDVVQVSFGGGTIVEIAHQAHYYQPYNPDYVILQSGIVDCAYRSFPLIIDKGAFYSKVINIYRKVVVKIINPRLLRRIFKIRYTKPKAFYNSLQSLKAEFLDAKLIAIGIVPASTEYERLVPGISDSIVCYNNILRDFSGLNFVDLSRMDSDCVMSDYHHINKKGHQYIFDRIKEILSKDVQA